MMNGGESLQRSKDSVKSLAHVLNFPELPYASATARRAFSASMAWVPSLAVGQDRALRLAPAVGLGFADVAGAQHAEALVELGWPLPLGPSTQCGRWQTIAHPRIALGIV